MTRRELVRALGAAVAVLVLVPGVASAQSAISGVVRDTSRAVLPGVTVEAVSPVLIEKTRTVVTDNQGVYRFVDLRPGVYTVTFTLPGFSTVRREGLELPDAFTATINADLRVGSLEETITVTGASPLVDVQSVLQRQVLSNEVAEALPVSRFAHNYVNLMPGATGPVLGSVAGDQRKTLIHGGRIVDAIVAIDGFSVNFVPGFSGNSSFFTNMAVVEETSVQTGGGSAEQQFGGIFTNLIPKEGGNSFGGYFFGNYSAEGMTADNLNDELRAKGLTAVNRNKQIYSVEPAGGGPILRAKLWFYAGARHSIVDRWRTVRYDTNPLDWIYTPDLSRPPHHAVAQEDDYNLRLTWQATPRNKLSVYLDIQPHYRHQDGHESTNPILAPEATQYVSYWPNTIYNVTWKSPVSNRILFDVGASRYLSAKDEQPVRDPAYLVDPFSLVPAVETTQNIGFRASGGVTNSTWQRRLNVPTVGRVTASYVTGSHAVKFGWQFRYGTVDNRNFSSQDYSVSLTNGVPRSIEQVVKPRQTALRGLDSGFYAQDQWTRGRMTLNYGLRWDSQREWVPAKELAAGPYVPARSYPKIDNVPNYKDLSPRFGIAYDLFGDGKTAFKGTINRYLVNNLTGIAGANDPLALSVLSVARTWTDANTDFVPDCDLANPLANGECQQVTDLNFGKANPRNLGYHPDLLTGWGVRNYNWEISAQLQHELWSGVSANAGYFRRWYGGFVTTDNLAVTPADHDHYCVTAPAHAGLPGGGGYQVCDLYDVSVAKFGLVQNQTNKASVYGEQSETYNGFDVTLNMRLPQGGSVSGGLSSGRVHTVNCAVVDLPTVQYCDTLQPFQTQVKFLGRLPLPWWGLELSGVFQNIPGPFLRATQVYSSAQIKPSLGRDLSRGARGQVTVDLIQPNTMNLPRQTQVDFRLAKVFRYQRYRLTPSVDVFNVFNGSTGQRYNNRLNATWPTPQDIQLSRLALLNVQLTF